MIGVTKQITYYKSHIMVAFFVCSLFGKFSTDDSIYHRKGKEYPLITLDELSGDC